MRIIHSMGFSDEEKAEIKDNMTSNILSAIQTLLQNSTTDAWSAEMEEDARIVETLKAKAKPEVNYITVEEKSVK
jgi:hypothetical protein